MEKFQQEDWYYKDNGFSSKEEMDKAHKPVVDYTLNILENKEGKIVDLGCGNGALMRKIYLLNHNIVPYGIDIDPERIAHASVLLPEFSLNFFAGDVFEDEHLWQKDNKYALAIVMPGRFLETNESTALKLRRRLKKHCNKIVLYAYNDWLEKYGKLHKLAEASGFILENENEQTGVGLASLKEV